MANSAESLPKMFANASKKMLTQHLREMEEDARSRQDVYQAPLAAGED
jgi:DNA-binding HxlR family transcriptional regulator